VARDSKREYQKRKEYQKRYRIIHAVDKRIASKNYYNKKRKKVVELLGNKCQRCGFTDWRTLQIDHVNGGGTKEKKSVKVTFSNYISKKILNGSKEYQLLCANCNWIKRYENNETSHVL
jgi:hypothetical protein